MIALALLLPAALCGMAGVAATQDAVADWRAAQRRYAIRSTAAACVCWLATAIAVLGALT